MEQNKASGQIKLILSDKNNTTYLKDLFQTPPYRLLNPNDHTVGLPVFVLINIGGGILGGDVFKTYITVEERARGLFTTQSAEKVYFAPDNPSCIVTELKIEMGSFLEWMPHETILYNGARIKRHTKISAAKNSKLMAGEILVFGRSNQYESFDSVHLHDEWSIEYNDKIIWKDYLHIEPEDTRCILENTAGFNGAKAFATIAIVCEEAHTYKEEVRALLEKESLFAHVVNFDHLLIIKILAMDTHSMLTSYINIWSELRYLIAGLTKTVPRVWQF